MISRSAVSLWRLCIVGLLLMMGVTAPLRALEVRPGYQVPVIATDEVALTRVQPPAAFRASTRGATSTIHVTYNGFTPEAQAAFQYAVDVWESLLVSPVTIEITANWTPLSPGVLGSAGPTLIYRDFSGAPQANSWYPVALANALYGADIAVGTADISANFSSTFDWYLGTDGNCPAGQYDLVTVVMHELGHGLGFLGSASYSSGTGSWGFNTGLPMHYDRLVLNGSGQQVVNTTLFPNPSTDLGTQLVSNNLFFDGANAKAANGGVRPKLYCPVTWQGGSSYSHWDDDTYPAGNPNSLMTHALASAEAIHSPGPLTLGLFKDIGWTVASAAMQPDLWNRIQGEAAYIGDNIYSTDGANQQKSKATTVGTAVTYLFRAENDGEAADTFKITGTAGGSGWTVRYYAAGIGEITADVTGAGWTTPSLAPGGSQGLWATVTPSSSVTGGSQRAATLTARSNTDTSKVDAVRTVTTLTAIYKPDNMVRLSTDSSYVGNNIYNLTGTSQTVKLSLAGASGTAVFNVQNDGNLTDSLKVTGPGSTAGYTVRYYVGGVGEVTAAVTGAGYTTAALAPGASKGLWVTVTPTSGAASSQRTLLITATSVGQSTAKDVISVAISRSRPDLQIRTSAEGVYTGNNVYNLTGTSQSKAQNAAAGASVTYLFLAQNDSDAPDTLKLTATAAPAGWTVRYYAAGVGEITAQITGAGYTTAALAAGASAGLWVTVSPSSGVVNGTQFTATLTAVATGDTAKSDVVKATTTKQ